MFKEYYCDFHIHIGRSEDGSPIKITAAKDLTFANIIKECLTKKGINMIGIVDCASPKVIEDIKSLLTKGDLYPISEGGYSYLDQVTVILGAEIETKETNGQAHCLCFFPTLEKMIDFSSLLSKFITNIDLSSQQCKLSMQELLEIVNSLEGILIPAHVFTPFKSIYGRCAVSIKDIFKEKYLKDVRAIELGLSSDSCYADYLEELSEITFLTNSDAHSLPKIGREYNLLKLRQPSFNEFKLAINRSKGRYVSKNFGLDPKLGKYHRTFCEACGKVTEEEPPTFTCSFCGERKRITIGVLDRLHQIKTRSKSCHPVHRPQYIYQVPLQFLPKIGPKTIDKLIKAFGSEMNVLHQVPIEELSSIVGPNIAEGIKRCREGSLTVHSGGGGFYGRIGGIKNE